MYPTVSPLSIVQHALPGEYIYAFHLEIIHFSQFRSHKPAANAFLHICVVPITITLKGETSVYSGKCVILVAICFTWTLSYVLPGGPLDTGKAGLASVTYGVSRTGSPEPIILGWQGPWSSAILRRGQERRIWE